MRLSYTVRRLLQKYESIQIDNFSTRLWANPRKSEFLFKICYLILTLEITLSDLSDRNGV